MISLPLNFITGLIVSFLGTLPLGVLNITIMDVSLKKGMKSAFRFALACAIVELVYSYISVQLTKSIIEFPALRPATEVIAIVTLFGMGIYYVRKHNNPTAGKQKTVSSFYLGTILSILNVLAFPFWILYTTLLQGKGIVGLSQDSLIAFYVLGISIGTIAGLLPFAYASRLLSRIIAVHQHRMDRMIGCIFILLSLCQFVSIIV
ncbi:LysE family transporter [Dyadobacter arcticus]|uniref:Threonine/homoserine/homoserine lactone efflux protein n=1 Tax=Dyadobacter arcticus TaxID=1078754 RepID=A0ABX0UJ40_9BACT|nr:LysE family transporter [Dyadobacter arcticus]NIJ52932.1 threonine/homoserine/homoserine lactone efflux protein [Dyadobacter arcticus]